MIRMHDLLHDLKTEHEKQLSEYKRNIHNMAIKQDELTHTITEKETIIKQQQDEIQQLKDELNRVNGISIVQRLLGKK